MEIYEIKIIKKENPQKIKFLISASRRWWTEFDEYRNFPPRDEVPEDVLRRTVTISRELFDKIYESHKDDNDNEWKEFCSAYGIVEFLFGF